ncbi:hypothetical protein ATCC90586_000704 [Pythium insidiosum]|nr:hypothetical protein ATCC90586_000704 [Pythium insidiosum]
MASASARTPRRQTSDNNKSYSSAARARSSGRTGGGAGAEAASSARPRPRPAWNAYLTDDTQYRLPREKQLLRHIQQLSAAHFHSRSPSTAMSSLQVTERQSALAPGGDDKRDTEPRDKMTRQHQRSTPSELSMLEHMLSELEHEAEELEHARVTLLRNEYDDRERDEEEEEGAGQWQQARSRAPRQLDDDPRWSSTETETETETEPDSRFAEDSLGAICFKSLRVGLELTRNMRSLSHALAEERRRRAAQDARVQELQQVHGVNVKATGALIPNRRLWMRAQRCLESEMRCEQLEERQEDVVAQLDGMKAALQLLQFFDLRAQVCVLSLEIHVHREDASVAQREILVNEPRILLFHVAQSSERLARSTFICLRLRGGGLGCAVGERLLQAADVDVQLRVLISTRIQLVTEAHLAIPCVLQVALDVSGAALECLQLRRAKSELCVNLS